MELLRRVLVDRHHLIRQDDAFAEPRPHRTNGSGRRDPGTYANHATNGFAVDVFVLRCDEVEEVRRPTTSTTVWP